MFSITISRHADAGSQQINKIYFPTGHLVGVGFDGVCLHMVGARIATYMISGKLMPAKSSIQDLARPEPSEHAAEHLLAFPNSKTPA